MFKTPILMLKMKFFWLIFRGKFEQKTQKSIFLKNQWRLKNIKKAMVVKNIIAEDMPFTKSIFEQFWRSYCKKTIFVVFHFLKFLPKYFRWVVYRRMHSNIAKGTTDPRVEVGFWLSHSLEHFERSEWLIVDCAYLNALYSGNSWLSMAASLFSISSSWLGPRM